MDYQDINAQTINKWIDEGWEWGKPISRETYFKALEGEWEVFLTPTKPVPHKWFGNLKGKKLLGLASGGAQQMPIFAALGADCTVLDYSDKQLESERAFAEREGYKINIIKADMTKPLPFPDESFDIIFHPVSNCYVREVKPIWKECCRILKKGGVLLSGLDNGMNFIIDEDSDNLAIVNKLPFDPLADEELYRKGIESGSGVQFSHTLDEQLAGQLEAGLIFTDLYEDLNGFGKLDELNIPSFWASRAVKGKIVTE
ncbi:MAG: class I SAM-dependent methyltransferase [Ruminococcaceae bacterium]|nr:class I SAM-dependent methyltransferase [Oscillospiraceae bacterium]